MTSLFLSLALAIAPQFIDTNNETIPAPATIEAEEIATPEGEGEVLEVEGNLS